MKPEISPLSKTKSESANRLGYNQLLISAPIILRHRQCIDSPIVREELNKILAHIVPQTTT